METFAPVLGMTMIVLGLVGLLVSLGLFTYSLLHRTEDNKDQSGQGPAPLPNSGPGANS